MSAARKQVTLEEVWPMLTDGMSKLLGSVTASMTREAWMEMYSGVYNLCISRKEKELYDQFKSWVTKQCQDLYRQLAEFRRVDLLAEYLKMWTQFMGGIGYVHKIFDYLHRYWVPKNRQQHGAEEITVLALNTWREKLFNKLKDHVLEALLDQINRERLGEKIDQSMMRSVIGSYVRMGTNKNTPLEVYQADFEKPFIQKTRDFYKVESAEFLRSNGCALYMGKVDERIQEEETRVKTYLDASTMAALTAACDETLIAAHRDTFQVDFRSFLETDRQVDAARMYKLLQRLKDGLDYIRTVLKQYAQDKGEVEVKSGAEKLPNHAELRNSPVVVEGFIKLHGRCVMLVNDCFSKNESFMKAVDEAFAVNVNKQIGVFQMAEILAFYCNVVLNGQIKLSDEEMEKTFDSISKLFSYLSDKDLFHAFYRRGLCRRLLSGKTNEDAERSLITRFKDEYGAYFTSKLEGMINDMNASDTLKQRFQSSVDSDERLGGITMDVQVLNQQNWPITKSEGDQLTLPTELVRCQKEFDTFYQSVTQNKKLTWVYAQSNALVQLKYGKAKFELMCSTYQACIMLLFNGASQLTFKDIKTALGLADEDLAQCIEPLVGIQVKFKILTKSGDDAAAGFEDTFSWNDALPASKPPRRIPVPPVSGRAVRAQTTATNKAVEEERKYKIDAAVVRTMKARRRLHLNDLTAEVINQLVKFFQPDPRMIRKCIESLIDREYLDRDEADTNVFTYIT